MEPSRSQGSVAAKTLQSLNLEEIQRASGAPLPLAESAAKVTPKVESSSSSLEMRVMALEQELREEKQRRQSMEQMLRSQTFDPLQVSMSPGGSFAPESYRSMSQSPTRRKTFRSKCTIDHYGNLILLDDPADVQVDQSLVDELKKSGTYNAYRR